MSSQRTSVDNTPTHAGLMSRIKEAQLEVRKLKIHAPYLFPEWQAWQSAERDLKKAQEHLEKTKKRWEQVGHA